MCHLNKSLAYAIATAGFACAVSFAAPCEADSIKFWQDPVVTHTNGMRLASTTSQRSHNVYWQCDPYHHGYCNGRIWGPMRDDFKSIGTRIHRGYRLPYTPSPGPVSDHPGGYYSGGSAYGLGAHGIEAEGFERLGAIPNNSLQATPATSIGR